MSSLSKLDSTSHYKGSPKRIDDAAVPYKDNGALAERNASHLEAERSPKEEKAIAIGCESAVREPFCTHATHYFGSKEDFMVSMSKIVREALEKNFLSIAAEEQLRQCLRSRQYTLEELQAFWTLQNAAMSGVVQQESRII